MEGTRLSKGHAIVFAWEDYFVCISENRTKMGVMESLGVDGLLSDVQRMDKRQVSWKKYGFFWEGIVPIKFFFRSGCCFAAVQFFFQVLSFGMIVSSALMIWKGLMVATGSESPIVVVLSGSMEPAFHR